ncbi:MAG: hypothetical protein U0325_32515 [Polyangiales bacterium]
MADDATDLTLEGLFSPPTAFADQATAGFSGPGSLVITPSGLRLRSRWTPVAARGLVAVGGALSGLLLGGVLLSADLVAAGLVGFTAPLVGAAFYVRRRLAPRDFDAVVSWDAVGKPGVSQGALVFELRGEPAGMVRFIAAGADFAEMRRFAQAIKASAVRP